MSSITDVFKQAASEVAQEKEAERLAVEAARLAEEAKIAAHGQAIQSLLDTVQPLITAVNQLQDQFPDIVLHIVEGEIPEEKVSLFVAHTKSDNVRVISAKKTTQGLKGLLFGSGDGRVIADVDAPLLIEVTNGKVDISLRPTSTFFTRIKQRATATKNDFTNEATDASYVQINPVQIWGGSWAENVMVAWVQSALAGQSAFKQQVEKEWRILRGEPEPEPAPEQEQWEVTPTTIEGVDVSGFRPDKTPFSGPRGSK